MFSLGYMHSKNF